MRLLPLLLLAGAAEAQEAPRAFACVAQDGGAFALRLDEPGVEGTVHCLDGAEGPGTATLGGRLVASCAPQGGWGLTEGGSARPAAGASEAAGFEGPRFFAHRGLSEFVAAAAFGRGVAPVLEIGGPTVWRLRMALATGEGSVWTADGEARIRCTEDPRK